jgi:hypothetical protein
LPILVTLALSLAAIPRPVGAEEIYSDDLPSWIPSFAVGGGIYSREVDGTIEGIFDANNPPSETPGQIQCRANPDSPLPSTCDVFTKGSEAVDGFSLQLQGGLLGPAWEDGPWRPRPFIQGGYGYPFKKRRVTSEGQKASDFDTNQSEPDIRLELIGKPQHFWWLGGGVAFQLPVEAYPTWFKLGVNYIEDKVDAVGKISQTVDAVIGEGGRQRPIIEVTEASKGLRLSNVGPSFGLETMIARWGPVAMGFSADFFVGFPFGATKKRFQVDGPGLVGNDLQSSGTGTFKYDSDSPWFFGNTAIRIMWIGDPD